MAPAIAQQPDAATCPAGPAELAERYARHWARHRVQVVRCGEPSRVLSDAELYLLLSAGAAPLFPVGRAAELLAWQRPDVLWLRIRQRGGADGATRRPAMRIALTADRCLARIWQNSPSAQAASRRLRRGIARGWRSVHGVAGSVIWLDEPRDRRRLAAELREPDHRPLAGDSRVARVVAQDAAEGLPAGGEILRCAQNDAVGRAMEGGSRIADNSLAGEGGAVGEGPQAADAGLRLLSDVYPWRESASSRRAPRTLARLAGMVGGLLLLPLAALRSISPSSHPRTPDCYTVSVRRCLDVIRGRLALVGPGPCEPAAGGLRPGLTGPWLIRRLCGTPTAMEQAVYARDYIEHASPAGDLRIFLATLAHALGGGRRP